MDIGDVFRWTWFMRFCKRTPGSGVVGSQVMHMCSFSRDCHLLLQSRWSNLLLPAVIVRMFRILACACFLFHIFLFQLF